MKHKIWRFLYFMFAYGFMERPFKYAVIPEPKFMYDICNFLHKKFVNSA